MKARALAYLIALAGISFVAAPKMQAQNSGQITIKDPSEFNAYQAFSTQSDLKRKITDGEGFVMTYPQSEAKLAVLDQLVDAYQLVGDQDALLNAANRLLQLDPNNLEAIYFLVAIEKAQCGKTADTRICDDAAALAQKGLQVQKPASLSDDEWKKQLHAAFSVFHSAIALDDAISKKDWKEAQQHYADALEIYDDNESKTTGLSDTLFLAEAYSQPGSAQNLVKATWFYARAWNFASEQFKAQIEPKLEYYYKKYHGGLDGLDQIKQQTKISTFPPETFAITPAKSPTEQIHDLIAQTPEWNSLALADKEAVLAMGSKEDADALWAILQGRHRAAWRFHRLELLLLCNAFANSLPWDSSLPELRDAGRNTRKGPP
jgi:hypothetical protein